MAVVAEPAEIVGAALYLASELFSDATIAVSAVVRERLYRDAVDRAIAAGIVRWIPPPVGARYDRLRVSVDSGPASVYRIPDDRGAAPAKKGSNSDDD